MLVNLKRVYVQMHSFPQARDVTDLLLAVDPVGDQRAARPRPARLSPQGFSGGAARPSGAICSCLVRPIDEEEREEHEQIWEHVKTLRKQVASLN